ncbi:MAG: translocation/assembly module TamB domain-containing protein [Gemmatimonadaceae bacterium]
MKRRHLVVLVSAVTLLTSLFVAAVTIGVGVGTDAGRDVMRSLVQKELGNRVRGKVHLGRIRYGVGSFSIDSFAIRDLRDSLLVSTGRVSGEFDMRDFIDRRLLLRNVEVEHPVIRIAQYQQRDWNFQRIFRKSGPTAPNVPGRSFGDFVVLDSVRVTDGEFLVTRPWSPDDSLRGAKRDSAIRVNLENPNREIRRSAEGLTHTYRWSRISGFLPRVRLADPDSVKFGQLLVIDSLRVDELEPPFKFRNASGTVRRLGDSIFVEVPHFDLPASTGSAHGKIWWGSNQPTRMDIRIKGDSVSLNDVAWVYETLPHTGGGRTNLHITRSKDFRGYEFALTEMDVRSTKSRLTGAMTFVTGGPVLVVKDVDLRGSPINFDLVRTLAGGPLSVDWQGALYGMVRGPGGPLTNFVVDTSFVTFRDTHVVGAISQGSGRGELDILDPEFTVFHGFDVNAVSLDLRSIQYLFPEFPRIGGTVSGVARLDSLWLDVRFSNADLTHRNGPGDPTRVTGSGRVTTGEDFMSYDVAVKAQPLSLTMLSRAYPLGLKGLMSGPIEAKGTTDDLQLTMQLEGPAGRFSYSGKVDAYPLSVAARGTGRVDALDLAQLLDQEKTPAGFVTGSYQVDIRGDTNDLATLAGSASAFVERSELDGIRVFPSRLRARFADGRIFVDTLRIESVAATINAYGALGLKGRTADSLHYSVTVDSLGGLRRYLGRLSSAFRSGPTPNADSLAGSVIVQGSARGSLNAFDLGGSVIGNNVFLKREAGREITGSFTLANLLEGPTGTFNLRFSSLNVAGIALDTLTAEIRFDAPKTGSFTLAALAPNGVTLNTSGELSLASASTNLRFRQARLATDGGSWTLRGPAAVVLQKENEVTIDSLVLLNGKGGRVALAGFVPDSGRARIMLRADSVPLRDIGQVAQLRQDSLAGLVHVTATGGGTAAEPTMSMEARLTDVRYGGIRLERVNASGQYANRRAQVVLDLASDARLALRARGSLPVELSYFGATLLEDSLVASVRTDSASFSIIEPLVPGLRITAGNLVANLDIGGTWKHPDVSGPIRVENGELTVDSLGIRMHGVNVDVGFFGHRDSLAIRRVVAWSGANPGDSVSLRGYIAYRDFDDPYLDLRLNARTFRAFDRRARGRLDVSTEGSNGLRLRGQLRGATLTGGLVVDRGVYFLPDPELARKRTVDFSSVVSDTAVLANAQKQFARLFESVLFDGVRVTLGDEVWLRSPEANIQLVGALNVQRRGKRSSGISVSGDNDSTLVPVLDGELRAERGTYTLNLGRVVQREFQVEGGTITFFETAGLSPILNISALHMVRSSTGADIRIRVRLTGPIENPILTLESAESFTMSQSDMVSYLMFGQQNFELGAESKNVQLAAQILFPSATTFTASQLRGVIGPIADIIQLRPGSADLSKFGQGEFGAALGGSIQDAIVTSRLGAEKQISDRVFVSLSSALCFEDRTPNGSSELNYIDGLSGRFEYRFSRSASVKLGKEPAASTCRRGSSGRVVQAPSQWGLSLFKTWRF